ncbi:MvaI/BcnI family restriction endonuclease [Gemmatimonas sp.]|uniref:MvaI/BcnI family restriction endonuclease n=1 Tax=Gemmatimonas sp. TaxID=1962908 RepID=UPI0025C529CF|nr:MvaI/BcnI family restriction endonuclease [Gemmatimonas sp.]MCA2992532.1 MvaI/BcnI restriction endonuclease family protein [Gemmatimonas sp.]
MDSLDRVLDAMGALGATRFYWKPLAPNDNSKNQIYLGGDFAVLNSLPAETPYPAESGTHRTPIFKAPVWLEWLDVNGQSNRAPGTQFILYPQYPEIRLSGFLRGANRAPSDVLTSRTAGRVLVLGVVPSSRIIAFAAFSDSPIAAELRASAETQSEGILRVLARSNDDAPQNRRERLLAALCRIHRLGWIDAWRLGADGSKAACNAPHCIGVTLESELGITANSLAEPDFEGWEVKAYSVTSFQRIKSGRLTLLTPEPTGGVYRHDGVERFVERYGYADKRGRPDRRNFGGIHRVGTRTTSTGLRTFLDGYDIESKKLTKTDGALQLLDDRDNVAAEWSFASLLQHWSRKHARAAYVPALTDNQLERRRYRYGPSVMLAVGTDYLLFLAAVAAGDLFLDPGVKVTTTDGHSKPKKRNQFRAAFRSLAGLYREFVEEAVCA